LDSYLSPNVLLRVINSIVKIEMYISFELAHTTQPNIKFA